MILSCLLIVVLVSIAIYDVCNYRIPNSLVAIFLILTMMSIAVLQVSTAFLWGCGFVVLKFGLDRMLKRPALGWGDVKLIMVMGLWLPWQATPQFLLSIGLFGLAFGLFYKLFWHKDVFPFAPALILGFLWMIKNLQF